jgi:hypothetical protein
MRAKSALTACLVVLCALAPFAGQAQDYPRLEPPIDTEHIFGFTEGADIGKKGEVEVENTTIGRLDRRGNFVAFNNETAIRYGVADDFRASFAPLTDYRSIRNVPGLVNRTALSFSGLSSEYRWQAVERDGIGLTFSLAPEWHRIDDTSGQQVESYAFPLGLLADAALVPGEIFAAFNLAYSPAITRVDRKSQQENPLEVSSAISAAIVDGVFLGAEIRHITRNQDGFFSGHALFVGPSLYAKVADDVSFKVGWSAQLPDETTGRLDLVNFERHQVIAVLTKSF